jgi:hypothetical protein
MTRRLTFGAIVLVLALLGAAGARGDVIRLASGDELRGEIVEETPAAVVLLIAGGRVRLARGEIVEIAREAPGETLLGEGDDLARLGAWREAADLYRRALAGGAAGAAARLARAENAGGARALARGDLAEATRRFVAALDVAATDRRGAAEARAGLAGVDAARARADELAGAGLRDLDAGRFAAALDALDRALALDRGRAAVLAPHRARAAAEEGARRAAAGDLARGAALFEESLAADPGLAPPVGPPLAICRVGLALRRFQVEDQAGAIQLLRDGLAADPGSRLARFYLGVTLEVADAREEAAAQYRTLLGAGAAEERDLAGLRAAAARTAGPLPVDPAILLAFGRSAEGRGEGAPPLAAERGVFRVFAGSALLAEQALAALERAAPEITAWAGESALGVPVEVVIYDTEAQYRAATGQAPPTVAVTRTFLRRGRAAPREISTFVLAPRLLEDVLPHELTHALTNGGGPLPLWISEGLAVSSERERTRAAAIARYRATSREGGALAIREIVRLRGYPAAGDVQSFYDGATALAAFFIERGGRERLLAAGRRAGAGALEPALEEAYGFADMDELAPAFESWLGAR